jgi:aryl-alcohol dehydrogenase-like predicted oxidoreductase
MPLAAVQLNYNLLTRALEPEFLSFIRASGLGLVAWGPLANGLLTGRYRVDRAERAIVGTGRVTGGAFCSGHVDPFDDVVSRVLAALTRVSAETGHSAAQLALAWLLEQKENSAILIGASSTAQLVENLGALDLHLPESAKAQLDAASAIPRTHPYGFLDDDLLKALVHGLGAGEIAAPVGPN